MALKSINPFTNKLIKEFKEFKKNEINNTILKSAGAFEDWKRTTFEYRKNLMQKVADNLRKNSKAIGRDITIEMGKPITEAKAEVEKCAWVCEYYANNAEVLLHREAVAAGAHLSFVQYEPLGTILGIMPWNFPFWQVFRFIAPTLMAGNTVLLKHASNVQICAQSIQNILDEAGFPDGVFQNFVIRSDKVKEVIEHDAVKAVTLTGSEAAGKSVASIAGQNLKKTVLELGGNNSFIVLDDADIDKAVEIGSKARLQNGGQSCIAAKRFIVHQKIADEFIQKFQLKLGQYTIEDPMKESTKLGPLSSVEQANTVFEQVERSVKMGAEVVFGHSPDGASYPPTLVKNVSPGMPLFDEEVFGPVAPIIIVKDIDEAITLSNQSVYGLGVTLFTNDLKRAEKIIPEFEDGAVFVNEMVKSDPRLPFGGTKKSGYGRELAVNGIREFVNVKTVFIEKLHDLPDNEHDTEISIGTPQ